MILVADSLAHISRLANSGLVYSEQLIRTILQAAGELP